MLGLFRDSKGPAGVTGAQVGVHKPLETLAGIRTLTLSSWKPLEVCKQHSTGFFLKEDHCSCYAKARIKLGNQLGDNL